MILKVINSEIILFRFALILRLGFWQNGFFADFIFEPPNFFVDFVAGFVLLIFVGKVPRKSFGKIPDKTLQILYNKNPRHVSAEVPCQ